MRISDWSSDVCSSYLAILRQHESQCHRRNTGIAGVEIDRALKQRQRRRALAARRGEQTQETRDVGIIDVQLQRRIAHRFAPGAIAGIEMRARHREQPGRARSEEHTSELQSLMRTSYAVFCLKKTTNKNN